jgi:FkbH-like protein
VKATLAHSTETFGERLRWQDILFAAVPRRAALLALSPSWPLDPLAIRVHRNHAVESALSVATPYLQFAGIEPEWILGGYGDSLAFAGDRDGTAADVEVVWLDYGRFGDRLGPTQLAGWLAGRLAALRRRTEAPILVLDWDGAEADRTAFSEALETAVADLHDVHLTDRSSVRRALGDRVHDPAREQLTGTRMSAPAALAVARLLGSGWIPALIRPRLKAVVVDLDNTLHAGVLGEDGSHGIRLTPEHRQLQQLLAGLHASGLFLGLLSRNDADQVQELFAERAADLALGLDDFDATAISWEPKSRGLAAIATALRIDPHSILFVDDNPGELLEVAMATPGIHLVHASEQDPAGTARAIENHPGVFAFRTTAEDRLRSADLRANRARDEALTRAELDTGAYFRELGVTLTVTHDRPEQLARLADMSAKTNQFNLALTRSGSATIERYLADPGWQVSSAALEDRLTDSGVIAMLLARREGTTLVVEELTISCRAMGRRLEDLIVARMLVSGPLFAGTETVRFTVAEGPRNQPARDWLAAFVDGPEPRLDAARVREASLNPDVRIEVQ